MNSFLNAAGFLGTNATFRSDVTLVLTLITAVMFTIGWRLAVRGRYEAHERLQTVTVILNTLIVLIFMVTVFVKSILPGIPGKLLEGSYGLPTLHGLAGLTAMLTGLFVVGHEKGLIFKKVQIKNLRRLMRVTYILYMLATLGGGVIYVVVYVYGI